MGPRPLNLAAIGYNRSVTTRTSSELPAWYAGLSDPRVLSGAPSEATAVDHDSRTVAEGGIFVAIQGLTVDGNSFIPAAIERGARNQLDKPGRRIRVALRKPQRPMPSRGIEG